jgi:hypothetical protein
MARASIPVAPINVAVEGSISTCYPKGRFPMKVTKNW